MKRGMRAAKEGIIVSKCPFSRFLDWFLRYRDHEKIHFRTFLTKSKYRGKSLE